MTTYQGLVQPSVSSYMNGTGTPRDSAMSMSQAMNAKQASLNSIGGKKYKGGTSQVVVPQFQMLYPATNGVNNPNSQIKILSSVGMQTSANSVYDSNATKGGSRYKKRKSKRLSKSSRRYKKKKTRKRK